MREIFLTQNTKEEDQTELAVFHLQGQALTWFIRLEQHTGQLQWSEFTTAINKTFGPHTHHNHLGQLSDTMQMGELEEYNNRFTLNLTKVPGLPHPNR